MLLKDVESVLLWHIILLFFNGAACIAKDEFGEEVVAAMWILVVSRATICCRSRTILMEMATLCSWIWLGSICPVLHVVQVAPQAELSLPLLHVGSVVCVLAGAALGQ